MPRPFAPRSRPGLPRREFLGLSLGGALGLALGSPARLFAQERPRAAKLPGFGGAKRCVVLWLNGGPSQFETFDPKPGHRNGGPTQAIRTSVPGVEIAHTLPRLAERMDRVALVRSMSTREGNHQRARYYLHTGYVPSGTVKHPDLGALVCQQLADPDFDLPSYVNIGGPAPGPGILGVSYAPFTIGDPRRPVQNLTPPAMSTTPASAAGGRSWPSWGKASPNSGRGARRLPTRRCWPRPTR